jgi:uncharacterized cupredoxin-like copper-binding protein
MKLRKMFVTIAFFALLATMLAACGGGGASEVDAALTSYNIALSDNAVDSGEVTFHVHNDADDLEHEFVIFKTDLPEDQLPLTEEGIVDENGEGVTAIDEVEVQPGESQDLTVNLDPGNYVAICNIDSDEMHYQHGMHASFTVN